MKNLFSDKEEKYWFLGIACFSLILSIISTFWVYMVIPERYFSFNHLLFSFIFFYIFLSFFSGFYEEHLIDWDKRIPPNRIDISSINFSYEKVKDIGDYFHLTSEEIIRWSYLLYVSENKNVIIVDIKKFVEKNSILMSKLRRKLNIQTNYIQRLINNEPDVDIDDLTEEDINYIVDKFFIRESDIIHTLSELSGTDSNEIKFIVKDLRDKLDDMKE